ncbi:MAG: cation diffusion facilitator family transporter [Prevotella sp.]|nr:cation diffusion facilitator family transporter [Prevotella sp.]MDY4217507.1 cation diffusion facilitator family transporter [Prevotella sp.]
MKPKILISNNSKHTLKERRIAFVLIFTLAVMMAEVIVGTFSHSMALVADGIHLGSHVLVIGLNWLAYVFVRRLEGKPNNAYDSDKILQLAAFTSGVLLLLLAVVIIFEGFGILHDAHHHAHHDHHYATPLLVALVGLATNTICVFVIRDKKQQTDYNIQAAYLHLLADVMMKFGTILAILCAWLWNIMWVDAVVAIVSAIVVVKWAIGLLWKTGRALTKF